MKEGAAPFLVETDRINGTLKDSSVETRWNATDSHDFDIFKSLGNTVSTRMKLGGEMRQRIERRL